MHIPGASMVDTQVLGFTEALSSPGEDYDRDSWLYVPPFYAEYRYVLGTLGQKPLICIGLNPSTARPGALDNTLKSVERVARHNGFDSFLMMNLYPQRATRPKDMDNGLHDYLHQQNLLAFAHLLGKTRAVWAAWGAVMETRGYLRACMEDFVRVGQELGAVWYTAGKKSKAGHPHHPLYLKKDSSLDPFDITAYLHLLEA